MNRGKKGDINSIIIIIGAVVLLLIVLGIFIYQMWPWIRYGPFSPCWAEAVASVNTLAGFDLLREPQTIKLGDCLNALYLVNGDTLDEISEEIKEFKKELDCPDGGKSYVIAVPILEGGEFSWNIFKWPREALRELKERFYEKVGLKTYCKILSRERPYKNPTPFKAGGKIYCVDIAKDKETETYTVYFCEGSCDECGPNPQNPGLFSGGESGGGGAGRSWYEARREI
jgi:hypothetical protein